MWRFDIYRSGVLALLLIGAAGCTTQYDEPNELHSFNVKLSAGQKMTTGSPESPLPYISGTSCIDSVCPNGEECVGFCSIDGEPCSTDDDCPTTDYCRKVCAKAVYVDIEALGPNGDPLTLSHPRQVHFQMVPGMVQPPYQYATIEEGTAGQIKVYIAQAVSESHMWVEDIGMGENTKIYGDCNNGIDDDEDGLIDLADPNCLSADDPTEAQGSYATGLSPTFYFERPRIWNIQYTDQISNSPLAGQSLFVDRGDLVVTNITGNGFFVTDLNDHGPVLDDGSEGYFSSFFFYTFNKPEGVYYGDNLCSFSGGLVEYQGNTQMTFPTYEVYRDSRGCSTRDDVDGDSAIPDPVDVTELLIAENPASGDYSDQVMANGRALEPFESALIKIRDVDVSTRYLSCDADEDGEFPYGSDDNECRDICQEDPACTQLESFFEYSQLAAYMYLDREAGTGKKFYVGLDMLKENVPLEIPYIGAKDASGRCPSVIDAETGEVLIENPHKTVIGDTLYWEYTCPEMQLESIIGSLRHIYLCNTRPGQQERCGLQMHMLLPRFDEDFEFKE